MDPDEQWLRDEEAFRHFLWRPRNPNPAPVPPAVQQHHYPLQHCPPSPPPSNPHPSPSRKSPNPLHISNPTSFKPDFSFRRNKKGMTLIDCSLTAAAAPEAPDGGGKEWPVPEPVIDPSPVNDGWASARAKGKEWPVPKPVIDPSPANDGWASARAKGKEWPVPEPVIHPSPVSDGWATARAKAARTQPTAEEAAAQAVLQMQHRVLDSFGEFLTRKAAGSDSDESDDEGEEDGGVEESEEYKFLLGVFVRDRELRDYYEKNCESGDFFCLVCGANKKRGTKKFKSCDGLLQHSISIAKTNRRRAHRALGLVICKVLGWDVDRLPVIVVKGEPLSRSLAIPSDIQKTVPEEVTASSSVKNLEGVNKGESTDKMDPVSSPGWPCREVTASPNSAIREWPNLPSDSSELPASAEEVAKLAAEQKVLVACRDFFRRECGSEGESEQDEDSDGTVDDAEDDDCEDGESEVYKFFIKLFMEDAKLRTYYENRHEDGDFLCLVCAGVKKKTWRRFKGCVGLLHHSNSVWKTKKRAHRAYTRSVCKVLGWDIDQLPQIVRISEPLGSSLVDSTIVLDDVPVDASGAGWPCEDIKDGSDSWSSEWPNLKLPSDFGDDSVSTEEREKVAAEQKILGACRDFFHQMYGFESDEDDAEGTGDWMDEEDDEDEDVDDLADEECEEFKFFVKLFEENANLRSYYQNSHGNGDFLCLVCRAVKKKAWRRFKGCIGLLHHSNTIWKVKKKAHRAYARALCKVLSWDIERLPTIVSVSEPLGQPAAGTQDSGPLPASSAEWPCIEGPDPSTSEWPDVKLPSESVSAEEIEKLAAEQKVLVACRSFFHGKYGPELDEDDDDEEGDDSMDEDDDKQDAEDTTNGDPYGNSEEFKFFMKLFAEDEKLRSFYDSNHGSGDFSCLVCAAVSKKAWKRFKGCTGLLSHANSYLETKRKAHRAYTRAVCRTFGWDIKQLPRIVPAAADPLGHGSVAKPSDLEGEVKTNGDEVTIITSGNSEHKDDP